MLSLRVEKKSTGSGEKDIQLLNASLITLKGGKVAETDKPLKVTPVDNATISIEDSDPRSYFEWYSNFIQAKQLAMLNGGSSALGAYSFERGLIASYLRTINRQKPDRQGMLVIQGSRGIDVTEKTENGKNELEIDRLAISRSKMLEECHLFTMRLLYEFNYVTTRMLQDGYFDKDVKFPEGRTRPRGTLLNYQANVARWNFLVWRSTYIHRIEANRHNLALSIGYRCVTCGVSGVTITTTITKKHSDPLPEPLSDKDGAYGLTIYKQAASDERAPSVDKAPKTTITKNDDLTINGLGADAEYPVWTTIQIVQELPSMQPADKYSELFSLSPGMGIPECLYIPKSDVDLKYNKFDIEIEWKVGLADGTSQTMVITKEDVQAVALMAEETESSETAEEPTTTTTT